MHVERLKKLPPYLFVEIDRKKNEALKKGVDVISLGVGDPDLPTPEHIVRAAKDALDDPSNHHYPFGRGLKEFRTAVARWYKSRFGVDLDPDTQIHSLLGSKEGIGHLPLAFAEAGKVVLCPEPAYPVYKIGTIFAGGEPYMMPLKEENGFLPDLEAVPRDILSKASLMFINYPNNPTASVCDRSFFVKVVEFAREYGIKIAHDAAYTEIYYEDKKPLSFLEIPGAKEIAIEFHSLSKTYSMTGWRIGWVCGNRDMIDALARVKDNLDSGVFQAIQAASVAALEGPQDCVERMRDIYQKRRDVLVSGLNSIGFKVRKPSATFYVWTSVPDGYSSAGFVEKMLDECGIVATPGNGLGPSGEGYVRFSLTAPESRIKEAVERIKKVKW